MISIITVVYNDQKGLALTLNSLKDMDSDKYEHVIIDGGSSDGTLEIIEGYSFINKKVISEKDEGIYDAMNKGISIASQKYIVFLNAGDLATNDFFLAPEIIQSNKKDFYYSGLIFSKRKKRFYMPKKLNQINEYLQKMPFPHPGLFVKRSVFKEIGKFDLKKKRTADHEWVVRLMRSEKEGELIARYFIIFDLSGFSLSYNSIIEMFHTARNYGRNLPKAIVYLIYGFLVVSFYKFYI